MATSREIGGSTAGLGVATARLSITNVPSTTGIGVPFPFDVPPLTNSNAPFATDFVNLSSGANTITVPPNAAAVYMCTPNANAVTWTLKGISGDTGLAMNVLGWLFIPIASSVTSLVVTTGGTLNGFFIAWF